MDNANLEPEPLYGKLSIMYEERLPEQKQYKWS